MVRYSRAAHRTPTLLLGFGDRDPAAAYAFLAERGVNAPAGTFYAIEASRWLGLGDAGALRVGLAPYVDDSDVDRLLSGLRGVRRGRPLIVGPLDGFRGTAAAGSAASASTRSGG